MLYSIALVSCIKILNGKHLKSNDFESDNRCSDLLVKDVTEKDASEESRFLDG